MPRVDNNSLLAVIDIGSNSVRMVIYDVSHFPLAPPEKIFNEKIVCPLGRDLSVTGRLCPDAVPSAYKALQAYKLIAEAYHVVDMQVVGTAALREATDGLDFLNHVQDVIGLSIRVISGDAEAQYAARGVLMFDVDADGVVADFGGGSLEFARIHDNQVFDTVSLPLGAYRVMALDNKCHGIESLVAPYPSFQRLKALYAIGGSWRVLASAYMKEKNESLPLQGYVIPAQDLIDFCQALQTLSPEDIRHIYRMEAHQAQLAPVAALTLAEVLRILAPQDFVVSTAGVRDGVVHEFLSSRAKKQ